MIPRRIIPQLLLMNGRLVKGTSFSEYVDVGDPISQCMVFDAQGADEIILVDIGAMRRDTFIDPELIKKIIKVCRLPISVGGGINNLSHAEACFEAGADRLVLNTSAVNTPLFIEELSKRYGQQAVLVAIDILEEDGEDVVFTHSGSKKTEFTLHEISQIAQSAGAGELMVTSIANEGQLRGLNIPLYQRLEKQISIPFIASGGAGSYVDLSKLFLKTTASGCGIGKMLALRDYDVVRIKSFLANDKILVRSA